MTQNCRERPLRFFTIILELLLHSDSLTGTRIHNTPRKSQSWFLHLTDNSPRVNDKLCQNGSKSD